MLVPQLSNLVYAAATVRLGDSSNTNELLYLGFGKIVRATAAAAAATAQEALDHHLHPAAGSAGTNLDTLHQCATTAWQSCADAHQLQRLVYGYLDRFHCSRSQLPSLAAVCAGALALTTEVVSVWEQLRRDHSWTEPPPVVVHATAAATPATSAAALVERPARVTLVSADSESFTVDSGVAYVMTSVAETIDGFLATGGRE